MTRGPSWILPFAALLVGWACAAHAGENPCAKVRIGFHESIAAQGFLGLATPKADYTTTREAFNANLEAAKEADAHPDDTWRIRDAEFDWTNVCKVALAQGKSVLWIGCRADSSVEDGKYYARSLAAENDSIDELSATCVVSTYDKAKSPSWKDLLKTALFHTGGDSRSIYPGEQSKDGGRYKQLKKRENRIELYRKALYNSVELYFWDHRNDPPAADPTNCP